MTTTSSDHRSTVLGIYAAFGRGDIAGVLSAVGDEPDWGLDPDAAVVAAVPWLGRVNTKDEVGSGYFAGVAGDLEWHAFEPMAVGQDGDHVVAVLRASFTVRATGKGIDALETHFFTFGPDGRIARYRPILDTAAFIDAFTAD
jgi:ketosteroid isomerase-like protein